jgi:hypothetical protein
VPERETELGTYSGDGPTAEQLTALVDAIKPIAEAESALPAKGNRAKCGKHGLSISVIEAISPARLPFSPMRTTRNASAAFAP